MAAKLEASIVRIHGSGGEFVGIGVLVAEKQILTSTYAISRALRISVDTSELPNDIVQFDFPFISPGHIVTAIVTLWHRSSGADIAGLTINDAPPIGAQAVHLIKTEVTWGHSFRSFGVSEGYPDGIWVRGIMYGKIANGWLQIEVKESSHKFHTGFVATPVWDEDLEGVVGILVAFDQMGAGFVILTNALIKAWPMLGEAYRPAEIEAFNSQLEATASSLDEEQIQHLTKQFYSLLYLSSPVISFSYNNMLAFLLETGPVFVDIKLPATLPFIYYKGSVLAESDLDSLRFIISDRVKHSSRIAVLVLLGENEVSVHSQKLLSKMREIYAYDVILLGRNALQQIVMAKDPWNALRQQILPQVNFMTLSPFIITGPASDKMFFGREHELREINDHISTRSYVLIGTRRIGKTSILRRLWRYLPAADFRVFFHDCSISSSETQLIGSVLTNKEWFPEKPETTPKSFIEVIELLISREQANRTGAPARNKPLVILLDEADALITPDRTLCYPLFKTLRAISNSGRCRFILSGERTLRSELTNPKSPLYNFANDLLLGSLDFIAVEELITRPMKLLEIELIDEVNVVRRIYDFTSGHPNIVQRLCHRLIKRLSEQKNRSITIDDVNAVIEDYSFQREDFLSTYWEMATSLEKIISLVMAGDENIRTLGEIRKSLLEHCNLHPKAHEVDNALQLLVDLRSILRRAPTGYEFAIEAFPLIVSRVMSLEDMLEILIEEYLEQNE